MSRKVVPLRKSAVLSESFTSEFLWVTEIQSGRFHEFSTEKSRKCGVRWTMFQAFSGWRMFRKVVLLRKSAVLSKIFTPTVLWVTEIQSLKFLKFRPYP